MAQAAVQSALLESVVDIGNWRVTLLDSAVPGSVPGYLQDEQLQLLALVERSAGASSPGVFPPSSGVDRLCLDGADRPAQSRGVVRRAGPFSTGAACCGGMCIRKSTWRNGVR
jgi:3',5'-cyclic AMP phosphodiesterase CpdA